MGKMHGQRSILCRRNWRLVAGAALLSFALPSCTALAEKTPLNAIDKSVSPEEKEFTSSDPDVTSFLKYTADGFLEHSPNLYFETRFPSVKYDTDSHNFKYYMKAYGPFLVDQVKPITRNAGTVELDADRVIVIRYPVETAGAEPIEPRIVKIYPEDPAYSNYLERYHLKNIGDAVIMKLD